jgi:hypothetical protein
MPAAQEPLQTTTDLQRPFHHGALTITPLAGYSIKAVVLSRQRYFSSQGVVFEPRGQAADC